jgi:hypothetical protein
MRVSLNSWPTGDQDKDAYVEEASTGAHYETNLVEESGTRSAIVRLSIGQVRPCIGDVYHRRKLRIPRPKLHGGHLHYTSATIRSHSQ